MLLQNALNFQCVSDSVTTSGSLSVQELMSLRGLGYEVVVNLLPDSSQYSVPDERSSVESQGLEYIYIPVDFEDPSIDDFEKFANVLDAMGNRKVHIHCAANYRVSAFCALYSIRIGRWSPAQAESFIAQVWTPADYPGGPEFISNIQRSFDIVKS